MSQTSPCPNCGVVHPFGNENCPKVEMRTFPAPAPEVETRPAAYTIFTAWCPFRKNNTPVLGTMGSTTKRVVVIEADEWRRMCAEIPQLQTTQFRVGDL